MDEPTNDKSVADLIDRFGYLWAHGIAEQDRRDPITAAKAAGATDIQEWIRRYRA